MKRYLFFAFCFWIPTAVMAQDFIPNGSFEIFYSNCDEEGADCAKSWYRPTLAIADYFNTKNKRFRPDDKSKTAFEGNGFIGMYTVNEGEREYVSVHLHYTLRENYIYEITLWSRMDGDSSTMATPIQVHFSQKPMLDIQHKNQLKKEVHGYLSAEKSLEWKKSAARYTATGGEHYLTLGYFDAPELVYGKSYHYIDSVSLVEVGKMEEPEKNIVVEEVEGTAKKERGISIDEEGIEEEETITFEHIHFQMESAVLSPSSYKELDAAAKKLLGMKDYKVQVYGHTDNTGNPSENKALSKERAKAVATYLISKGVSADDVSWEGFGSERPRASNDTAEGRQKNRRVECRIIR